MDLDGGQDAGGARVQVWGCNGCWNQQWVLGGGVVGIGDHGRSPLLTASGSPRLRPYTCPAIPSPSPSPCTKGGWPQFANAAAISASPWGNYFKAVYGGVP